MAKKKSTKKNGMGALMSFVTMAIGGIILGFLALPHIKYETSNVITGTTRQNISAYQLMTFEEGTMGISIVVLLAIITASLMCLCALLKLTADLGVVKSSSLAKIVSLGMVISALATFALMVTICIMIPSIVKDNSFNLGGFISAGRYAVWGSLITNVCIAFVGFVSSLFAIKK